MIRAIIFDWHGVLDKVTYEDINNKLSVLANKSRKDIDQIINVHKKEYVLGILSPFLFWSKISVLLGIDREKIDIVKDYSLSLDLDLDLWSILSSYLVLRFKLAVLSDCPPDKASIIRGQIDLSIFNEVFFSCEIHKYKESEEFFLLLSDKLQVEPRETLYVDDTIKHLDFAKKLGYQTHHFKTSAEFKRIIIG